MEKPESMSMSERFAAAYKKVGNGFALAALAMKNFSSGVIAMPGKIRQYQKVVSPAEEVAERKAKRERRATRVHMQQTFKQYEDRYASPSYMRGAARAHRKAEAKLPTPGPTQAVKPMTGKAEAKRMKVFGGYQ